MLKKDAEVTVYQDSRFLSLAPVAHGKIQYAEGAESAKFSADTGLHQDGNKISWISGRGGTVQYKPLDVKNGDPFDFYIHSATVVSEEFHFVACSDAVMGVAAELNVNGYCNVLIKGDFSIKSSVKFFDSGRFSRGAERRGWAAISHMEIEF